MYKNSSLCKLAKSDGEVSAFEDKSLRKSITFDTTEFTDFNSTECTHSDWLLTSNLILALDAALEVRADF